VVETSDEWIRTRTGIERRHVASEQETSGFMAVEAAHAALRVADADPRDIDLIVVGTSTPDYPMPSTACQVQNALGATKAGAFDLSAGCSGFAYALNTGHQAIASGEHSLVLVIGVDSLSKTLDWGDRGTCVLFGDGAGAVLLRATEGETGVLSTLMGSDGSGEDMLIIHAGGSAHPASEETVAEGMHYLRMNGREVYRFAVRMLPQATEQVVKKSGLSMEDIDLIIPHQANQRILNTAAKRLRISPERFFSNLHEYGNTSAASIPIALCDAVEAGHVVPGQHIVLVGFGAGLTWASAVVRWGVSPEGAVSPWHHIWWRWILYRWAGLRSRARHLGRRVAQVFVRRSDGSKRER